MDHGVATKPQYSAKRRAYKLRYNIGFLLHDVSRIRQTVIDKAFKPLGITRSQWWLLVSLSQFEGAGVSQRQLATAMSVSAVSIGETIGLLESHGFVERRSHEQDKRQKLIFMTDKGAETLDSSRAIAGYISKAILQGISAEDGVAGERMLRIMRDNLLALER